MERTCLICQLATRPFPPEEFNGRVVILSDRLQFVERLAYGCVDSGGCGGIYCAQCCHPPALVRSMLQHDREELIETDSAATAAKCPRCGKTLRRIQVGQDENAKPEATSEWDKPTTWGQRVAAFLVAAFCLSISAFGFLDGAWTVGICWGVPGLGFLFFVFSK